MTSGGSAVSEQGGKPVSPELARRLLVQLVVQSPDLRDAALIDRGGGQIAATDDADWSAGAAALWRAADGTGKGPGTEVHVATEDGEVFSVRDAAGSGRAIVATGERFTLASLTLCDLRGILRALGGDR